MIALTCMLRNTHPALFTRRPAASLPVLLVAVVAAGILAGRPGLALAAQPVPIGSALPHASVVPLTACRGADIAAWTTIYEQYFSPIQACVLVAPSSGQLFIAANASVEYLDGAYEVVMAVSVDSPLNPEPGTLRHVNVYSDSGDSAGLGGVRPVTITLLKAVPAGTYTIYSLGKRFAGAGAGTVYLRYPSLSVVFIPDDSGMPSCGVHGDRTWTSAAQAGSTWDLVDTCSVTLPNQDGYLFISADASLGEKWSAEAAQRGDYQANFRISVGGTADRHSDRFVDIINHVTNDDGSDKVVALSVLRRVNAEQPIKPGTSVTVYLLASRHAGSASTLLSLRDPTLSVIFFPDLGFSAHTCGSPPPQHPTQSDADYWDAWTAWTWGSASFGNIRQCSASVPADGWALLVATASVARPNRTDPCDVCAPYQAEFRLGVDTTAGLEDTRRLVNIYDDPAGRNPGVLDGSDESLSLVSLRALSPGPHTFYLVGQRRAGPGMVLLWYPNLTVIIPNGRLFFPLNIRQ